MNTFGDLLIGLPDYLTVLFAYLNVNDWQITFSDRKFSMNDTWGGFGHSVAWLPDQQKFAVLADEVSGEKEAYSLIFFFNYSD